MNNYCKEPLLEPGEDLILGRLVQAGKLPNASQQDKIRARKAKDRMILANVRFVILLANKHVNKCKSLTLSDLVQEGLMGASYAVDKFDPTKGYKFTTYARNWINQYIMKAISFQDRLIRIPMDVSAEINRLQRFQPIPSAPRKLDCSVESINAAIQAFNVVSLAQKREDSGTEYEDLIADPKSLTGFNEYDLTRQELDLFVSQLNEEESFALKKFYGLDGEHLELTAIASALGLKSRESARRIKNNAVDKLKKMISDSRYSCFCVG